MRLGTYFTFAAAALICACQSSPSVGSLGQGQSNPERVVGEYRLGASDEIRVTVFGEPELSGEYLLDGAGSVSLPLIGQVTALDLTLREFESVVAARFANGYLRNPRVNAEVMNYRPFYILGEVRTPGEYPYSSGLTVLNAVATAGGFTYRANDKFIYVRGADDTQEYKVGLDPTTPILPGDTIRVAEKFF